MARAGNLAGGTQPGQKSVTKIGLTVQNFGLVYKMVYAGDGQKGLELQGFYYNVNHVNQ